MVDSHGIEAATGDRLKIYLKWTGEIAGVVLELNWRKSAYFFLNLNLFFAGVELIFCWSWTYFLLELNLFFAGVGLSKVNSSSPSPALSSWSPDFSIKSPVNLQISPVHLQIEISHMEGLPEHVSRFLQYVSRFIQYISRLKLVIWQ